MELSEKVIEIDVRCPFKGGPEELLCRLELGESVVEEDIEDIDVSICVSCSWCGRKARKANLGVHRIIHKYNMLGDHIDTIKE